MSTGPAKSEKNAANETKINQLLREGMAAAKLGDKETARSRFQEIVALDQYNEQGWFWLASVVDSDEERKVCLGNVIVINPGNTRAQKILDRLSHAAPRGPGQQSLPFMPSETEKGPDRRRLVILGSIIGIALVLVVVLLALKGTGGSTPIPTLPPTNAALGAATSAATLASGTRAASTGAATEPEVLAAFVTQTPAPTFTALPSSTKSGILTGTPMAVPPSGLPGHLIAVSGGYIGASDINLSLFQIDPADWKLRQLLPGERGEYAVLLPDGQRLVYSRLVSGLNTQQLRISLLDGTQASDANTLWGNQPPLADQRMVAISRSGVGMVLAASNIVEGDNTPDIYYLPANVTVMPAKAPLGRATPADGNTDVVKVSRVTTKDSGYHSWPSLSPNGKTVVFANNGSSADLEGTHIFTAPIEGGTPKDLTSTMDALAETEPEWSPDGTQIVFRSIPKNSPPAPNTISNLYVMKADGSGKRPLVNDIYNNIRPHWSPDGKYVAFSSTRNGKWEIYLVEVAGGTIYQVTQTDKVTLCTSWSS